MAYLQSRLGGKIPFYLAMDRRYFEYLVDRHDWECLTNPVGGLGQALYGLQRAGFDFTSDFQAWMVMNLYRAALAEAGVLNHWHNEDNAAMVRRAAGLRD